MSSYNNKKSYIALGSFDGVHIGHLTLVKKIVELAKENQGYSILYTFENHPRTLIKGSIIPKTLLDNRNKNEYVSSFSVDEIYFEKFTEEYMKLSPEGFIKYLCEKFNVKGIVVGFNYKFGYKNLGDVDILEKLSHKYNYELYIMEPCRYEDEVVSSTRIRKALEEGKVDEAEIMLNRPYEIEGTVIHGKKLGRTIGFPTANISIEENKLIPAKGVYYTRVIVDNEKYKGITSVGNNPTVGGEKLSIETYILDFNDEIYDKSIKINFLERIRGEIKFASIEGLVEQLKKDEFFAKKAKRN